MAGFHEIVQEISLISVIPALAPTMHAQPNDPGAYENFNVSVDGLIA